MRLLRPKVVCEMLGIHPNTLRRWIKEGRVRAVRTPKGRFRIPEDEVLRLMGELQVRRVIGYARVSSSTQRDDLERQKQLILEYAEKKGYGSIEVLTDIGSGLNERRRSFLKLLDMVSEKKVSKVIVAYPDRLTRFGFETLRRLFSAFGTQIEVINFEEKSPQKELVEDLVAIVSHFAGKLYGMRSHRYKRVVEGVKRLLSG
ncbi:IS607 family transposase [Candidatus Bathyarchaeota archaeon]|nr:MAG: IS607 family transposase [Candidatus Bathyarchaeota archaeon]